MSLLYELTFSIADSKNEKFMRFDGLSEDIDLDDDSEM